MSSMTMFSSVPLLKRHESPFLVRRGKDGRYRDKRGRMCNVADMGHKHVEWLQQVAPGILKGGDRHAE